MKQAQASQGKIHAKEKRKRQKFFLDNGFKLGYNEPIKNEIGG